MSDTQSTYDPGFPFSGIPALILVRYGPEETSITNVVSAAASGGNLILLGVDFSVVADSGTTWDAFLGFTGHGPQLVGSGTVASGTRGTYLPWRGRLLIPLGTTLEVAMSASAAGTLAYSLWGLCVPHASLIGDLE